jgi:plastocyanin
MLPMRTFAALVAAATALALGACGGDEKAQSGGGGAATATATPTAAANAGGGGETLKLVADPGGALKFDKDTLEAKAGKVTIDLSNPSEVPHAIEVEGNGVEGKGEVVTKGGSSKVTLDLKPGSYEYYCPVGNHKAAGMEGKLTVQ